MLKLTYTETALQLEYLAGSPEDLVARRVKLAMRVGSTLFVEPSQAAFLLPADLPGIDQLDAGARRDDTQAIEVYPADEDDLEVSLSGTWMAEDAEVSEGIFVASLSPFCEVLLFKLWQATEIDSYSMRDF